MRQMKILSILFVSAFLSLTSCDKKGAGASSEQQASPHAKSRKDSILLKENGELRVQPLPGMDDVKDAPKSPVSPTVAKSQEEPTGLALATPVALAASGNIQLRNATSGQSPMTRATVRTHAMEEMARQRNQSSEDQR